MTTSLNQYIFNINPITLSPGIYFIELKAPLLTNQLGVYHSSNDPYLNGKRYYRESSTAIPLYADAYDIIFAVYGYTDQCTPSCTGKQCGSDGCGGSCGTCSSGYTCVNNQCIVQSQQCTVEDITYGWAEINIAISKWLGGN